MDLFRLELEDCKFLPLERAGKNIVEHSPPRRHHEWLISNACINIFAIDFAKSYRRHWMFPRAGLSRVL